MPAVTGAEVCGPVAGRARTGGEPGPGEADQDKHDEAGWAELPAVYALPAGPGGGDNPGRPQHC